jgi:hypothetical protein
VKSDHPEIGGDLQLTLTSLKTIYLLLRWVSFLWLVVTILLVETTLYYNNVSAVLGGPDDNELHLPSQLIALMIGAFGLVRLCYLKLTGWRYSGHDNTAAIDSSAPPHPHWKPQLNLNLLKIFSPNFSADEEPPKHEDSTDDPFADTEVSERDQIDELDPLVKGKSWFVRCMISWLPWLVLIPARYRKQSDAESSSGHTPLIAQR